ncbi:endonuclease III [Chlorobium phaeovibrioides]|uniref:Endonuclease III n=1 Tax=Chlorobium phaeovibrioides TaxID=1094 RepID=A0A5M8ICH5_CHLPH|nr:endonuclease III [Chlorobium phaeovibrioides]KAA6233083.1 endonuclease III [Chlorobium phaeovibrioides]MWV53667.1 endonuclease III [Chlorobium phaeovibrioides]
MKQTPKEKIKFLKEVLGTRYPEPRSELLFESPFQLLIATILAAQATDRQVNIITRELFRAAPDAKSLSLLEPESILKLVRSINYCNNKAKNIRSVSIILTEQYAGKVPETREELEKLPGVGRKTANVVLAAAFHQPVMPVDTHVHRVSNRLGLCHTSKVEETEAALIAIIPEPWVVDFHHYLLLHGRYTCKAKKPDCPTCPLATICPSTGKTTS